MKYLKNILFILIFQFLFSLSIEENFFNESIIGYYLSAIDIETGESNLLLFDYTINLEGGDYDKLYVYFDIYMNIPSMTGSEYSTSLKSLTNGKFSLNPPANGEFPSQISFRNTDLNLDTQYLPGGVQFNFNQSDYNIEITDTEISDLTEMIMSMGRIPNGMYSFSFQVCDDDNHEGNCSDALIKNIEIFVPSYLELIMPGSSEISDTLSNIVYSSYPVFQWNTDYCSSCNYSIRISEFNSQNHSSLFEAIEDVSILPASGSGYYNISNSSNIFQYPESGVESLVQGKKYVWQILRSFETTNGVNEELSQIFIFKMQDATQMQTYSSSSSYDVVLDNIKELIGESIFNQLFGEDGELYNYNSVSSTITVNGEEFSNNYIIELIEMLNNNQINIIDVNAE